MKHIIQYILSIGLLFYLVGYAPIGVLQAASIDIPPKELTKKEVRKQARAQKRAKNKKKRQQHQQQYIDKGIRVGLLLGGAFVLAEGIAILLAALMAGGGLLVALWALILGAVWLGFFIGQLIMTGKKIEDKRRWKKVLSIGITSAVFLFLSIAILSVLFVLLIELFGSLTVVMALVILVTSAIFSLALIGTIWTYVQMNKIEMATN